MDAERTPGRPQVNDGDFAHKIFVGHDAAGGILKPKVRDRIAFCLSGGQALLREPFSGQRTCKYRADHSNSDEAVFCGVLFINVSHNA